MDLGRILRIHVDVPVTVGPEREPASPPSQPAPIEPVVPENHE